MSMAGDDLSAGLVEAMNTGEAGGTQEGAPSETQPVQSDQGPSAGASTAGYDTSNLSAYAQNFLAQLPEGERAKAAEYVTNWDKGFQSHSQQLNAQLAAYRRFGEPDALSQRLEIMERLAADPHGFTKALIEAGYGPAQVAQALQQGASQPQADPYEGLPPNVAKQLQEFEEYKRTTGTQLQRLEAALGGFAQQYQSAQQQAEQAEADKALDNMTSDAHTRLGAFDDVWVWTAMSRQPGLTIDAAVQQFRNMLSQHGVTQTPAPATMSASSLPSPAPEPLDSAEKQSAALASAINQLLAS